VLLKNLFVIGGICCNADAAMSQINLKNYPERFTLSGLPVVKVGISFDAEEHTLGDWLIEK
jgi:hypothetical protein